MRFLPVAVLCLCAAGCMVGPDYQRPNAPVPPAFKELAGFKPGEPNDGKDRGATEDCVTLTLGSGQWNDKVRIIIVEL